jgi:hypothetical protein
VGGEAIAIATDHAMHIFNDYIIQTFRNVLCLTYLDAAFLLLFFLFLRQLGQGHHNSICQLLWALFLPNPPCQLYLWEETGVLGENPRLSAER